ncbi:MAG TPA: chitobiase/beta-hexosaminidase C-terminal domain-containing protein, partial [Pirellulales bacterium]
MDAQGGYLALEMPDQSITSSFAPYPTQIADVSYGITGTSTDTEMLVDEQAPMRYNVPTSAASLASGWQNLSYDDSTASWHAGTIGIGYDTAPTASADFLTFINTDIGSVMSKTVQSGTNQTPGAGYAAFVRIPFTLSNKSQLTSLTLQLHYDDGYVAYLNGTEVSRANAFTGTPAFNSAASGSHTDSAAVVYQNIDLTSRITNLVNGNNELVIVGLNRASSSTDLSDFLIDPLLSAKETNPPTLGFMATPTPGAANNPGSLGFVADTKTSIDRGFYSSPFDVIVTTATPAAQIRYTVDGSVPTATTGLAYTGPIHISTTTNLRVAAFKSGYTPTNVDTETYIFLASVLQQTGAGLPDYAVWGQAGPDWSMDPDIVNSPTYSSQMIAAMTAIPTMSITLPWQDMFGANGLGEYIAGSGIPKGASTEYFTADGSQQFQIDDSIQIQGGTSDDRWKQDKLSFRVKFSGDYGPTKLDFPLFTDPTFDQGAATEFNTYILDAESNNVWTHPDATQQGRATYVVDQYVADLQNLAGGTSVHGTYIQLYIDGLYWGVYYLHERPDDAFSSSYEGGDK